MNIGQNILETDRVARARQFQPAAAGALLGCCSHKNLHLCIRADHGSYVAAIENSAGAPARKIPLQPDKRLAHGGQSGNHGGSLAHLGTAQCFLIECCGIQRAGNPRRRVHIIRRNPLIHHGARHCPIEEARIKARPAIMG